ncbi:hypothetical protein BS78_04G063100 [Paspalum vaginatum]|nr:hypothetical protein BS78_04G063100 [Paspalum vaginatum]
MFRNCCCRCWEAVLQKGELILQFPWERLQHQFFRCGSGRVCNGLSQVGCDKVLREWPIIPGKGELCWTYSSTLNCLIGLQFSKSNSWC